jgi:hypothetical protein
MLAWHVTVTDSDNTLPRQLSPDVLSALQGVRFIAQHIKDADKDNEVSILPCLFSTGAGGTTSLIPSFTDPGNNSAQFPLQSLFLKKMNDWK